MARVVVHVAEIFCTSYTPRAFKNQLVCIKDSTERGCGSLGYFKVCGLKNPHESKYVNMKSKGNLSAYCTLREKKTIK